MKIRNKAVPAVYIILENEGKILVARRYNTGYQDGNYNIPSGHVEEGELPSEAIIREAKEEIDIDLNVKNLTIAYISYRPKHDETGDRVDFLFRTSKWGGEVANIEPEKCDELKWVSPEELPKSMRPHVRVAIESMKKRILFGELDVGFLKKEGVYML